MTGIVAWLESPKGEEWSRAKTLQGEWEYRRSGRHQGTGVHARSHLVLLQSCCVYRATGMGDAGIKEVIEWLSSDEGIEWSKKHHHQTLFALVTLKRDDAETPLMNVVGYIWHTYKAETLTCYRHWKAV